MNKSRTRQINPERGAGALEYLGIIVLVAVIIGVIIALAGSSGIGQSLACKLRSAVDGQDRSCAISGDPIEVEISAGELGEDYAVDLSPTRNDWSDSDDLVLTGSEYAAAEDEGRGEVEQDNVDSSLEDFHSAMEGGWNGVRAHHLDDAFAALEDLNGRELDAFIAELSDEELKEWVSQLDDWAVFGGWSHGERREMWNHIVGLASKDTIYRLSEFTDDINVNFNDLNASSEESAWGEREQVLWRSRPLANDIRQGAIGDCYAMAAFMSAADQNHQLLQDRITVLPNGTYEVELYIDGEWQTTVVTPDLPLDEDGSILLRNQRDVSIYRDGERTEGIGVVWPDILEKALATEAESYGNIEGGHASDVMEMLTGTPSVSYDTSSSDLTIENLAEMHENGHLLTASSQAKGFFTNRESNYTVAEQDLVRNHAYVIHSVDVENGVVNLWNPWGKEREGNIEMPFSDFDEAFRRVDSNSIEGK